MFCRKQKKTFRDEPRSALAALAQALPFLKARMRASEIITIYLAAGAPFGMSDLLSGRNRRGPRKAVFKATLAMLLWPCAATLFLLKLWRSRPAWKTTTGMDHTSSPDFDAQIEQAKRKLIETLYKVEEMARQSGRLRAQELEQKTRIVCDHVERYVGLTMAASEVEPEALPDQRELELCRIAGRTGDDLLLAGRCIHRRNAARLIAHQARARTEFLHALACVREFGTEVSAAESKELATARHLSVMILRLYGHVINLMSLLEDERAAIGAARLLDAECARLRRLEADGMQNRLEPASRGEECTKQQTLHPSRMQPLPSRTLAQG
ncbi:MAG TPA: hypothetical protein VGB17_15150 [Pyrinomonadaceae bacterium]|jgi:hypothetical protein